MNSGQTISTVESENVCRETSNVSLKYTGLSVSTMYRPGQETFEFSPEVGDKVSCWTVWVTNQPTDRTLFDFRSLKGNVH